MWVSVVCSLINNDMRHHSSQNSLWTHSAAPRDKPQHFDHCDEHISVDKSKDNAKPYSIANSAFLCSLFQIYDNIYLLERGLCIRADRLLTDTE